MSTTARTLETSGRVANGFFGPIVLLVLTSITLRSHFKGIGFAMVE